MIEGLLLLNLICTQIHLMILQEGNLGSIFNYLIHPLN